MAGIYIQGLRIPEENEDVLWIAVHADGTVEYNSNYGWTQWIPHKGKAIPVPDHGDLIDRDVVRGNIKPWPPEDERNACTIGTVKKLMYTMLDRAPTVIPGSKEGDE